MPGRPDDADQPRSAFAPGAMEEVLELPQLLVAPDERRLEGIRAPDAAALRDDAQGTPGRDRADLALEDLVGRGLEGDRARSGALRRLADEHRRRRGDALEPAGRIDQVAGHHALVGGTQGDGGLAGQDCRP